MKIKEYLSNTKSLLKNLKRILLFSLKERKWTTIAIIVMAIATSFLSFLSSASLALLVQTLTNRTGVFSSLIILYVLLYIASSYIPDVISSVRTYAEKRNWISLTEIFQLKVVEKAGFLDIQTHDDPAFQDLTQKLQERDVWPALNTNEQLPNAIQYILQIIIALVILFSIKPWVSLVVLLSIVPQFFSELRYGEDSWSIWDADIPTKRRFWDLRSHFSRRPYLAELKLFQNVNEFYNRMKKMLVDFNEKQKSVEAARLRLQLMSSVISAILLGVVVVYISKQTITGGVAIGTFVFALGSITRLETALSSFFIYLARQYERDKYVTNMFDYFDVPLALPRSIDPIHLSNSTPKIEFENVSFTYPQGSKKEGTNTLKNISLTIQPGEKFALVGENGTGKTTFVRLLCRIYDPTDGRILIDGNDLKDIDPESWYSILGVLFQDYAPYYFKVKNAIALGRSNVEMDIERVKEAAEGSESDKFIMEWDDKYEQMIGTEFDGIDPSKGQNQRLAVARLMYRKAGVMILDEPTASIDAEAEMRIFNKIESLSKDQTVFLISHKYSTVRKADRICFLKDGGIHELGTHDELMAKKGTYARLFNEQAEAYGK